MKSDPNIEDEILSYLAENPNAQDTVEGITEWWISKKMIMRTASNVEAALAQMLARNLLSARKGHDGRIHYRCNLAGRVKRRASTTNT